MYIVVEEFDEHSLNGKLVVGVYDNINRALEARHRLIAKGCKVYIYDFELNKEYDRKYSHIEINTPHENNTLNAYIEVNKQVYLVVEEMGDGLYSRYDKQLIGVFDSLPRASEVQERLIANEYEVSLYILKVNEDL